MAATLDELYQMLERELPLATVDRMRDGHELDMIDYHMSTGMWLRNRWRSGLALPGELSALLPRHMDDLSSLALNGFWCHLHGLHPSIDELEARWKDNHQKMIDHIEQRYSKDRR